MPSCHSKSNSLGSTTFKRMTLKDDMLHYQDYFTRAIIIFFPKDKIGSRQRNCVNHKGGVSWPTVWVTQLGELGDKVASKGKDFRCTLFVR